MANGNPPIEGSLFDDLDDETAREEEMRRTGDIEISDEAIQTAIDLAGNGIPPKIVAKEMMISESQLISKFGPHFYPHLINRLRAVSDTAWDMAESGDSPMMTKFMLESVAKVTTAIEDSEIDANANHSVIGRRQRRMEEAQRRRQEREGLKADDQGAVDGEYREAD